LRNNSLQNPFTGPLRFIVMKSIVLVSVISVLIWFQAACVMTPAIGEEIASSGAVLFKDDFSDPNSGWMQGEDEFGKTEYLDGSFRILVNSDVTGKVSIPRLFFTDVIVEVDATKVAGPDDNDYGIICCYQDDNNFYFLEISSDGYYSIGKYKENQLQLLGMEQMQTSDVIRQGQATNRIQATCIGSVLSLSVNGQKLFETEDVDFSAGDVGLIAGTFETPGTDILFDNFKVIKP
jgi:hypothetical protein